MRQVQDFRPCKGIYSYDSVFSLKKPKLIESNSKRNIGKLIADQTYVATNSNDTNVNFYREEEKKHKKIGEPNGDAEIRKVKSRLRKKNRPKVDIKSQDLFVHSATSGLLINEDNDKSLLRQHKISKKKKKLKPQSNTVYADKNIDFRIQGQSYKEDKVVVIDSPLTVKELANKLNMPDTEIITHLFLQGVSVTVNQILDVSVAEKVSNSYNFEVVSQPSSSIVIPALKETDTASVSALSSSRSPVITMFGHVDHGKTTLLNKIVNSTIEEAGGITQSIGFYEIECSYESKMKKLVFLDMPGHKAFSRMRLRGAQVTDIALLVVAADDGLKPQTVEVIQYIKAYQLSCIVVITKVDKQAINISKIKEELAVYNIVDEKWGGDYPIIELSSLSGKNIDLLLSTICIMSDIQNLQVNLDRPAIGVVLESHINKKKGAVASIIIKDGTLRQGDFIVADSCYGKVRSIINTSSKKLKEAIPSSVVEILGFSSVLQVGMNFSVVSSEKEAKQLTDSCKRSKGNFDLKQMSNMRITLDNYKSQFSIKQLNIIVKADTQGSTEAIVDALSQITQDKVQISILKASSGSVSSSDLQLAASSKALIVCFNTSVSMDLKYLIKSLPVIVKVFHIIYDLIDYIKDSMIDLIDPEYSKVLVGEAVIQTIFLVNKGVVAGCLVTSGKLKINSQIELYRGNSLIYEGNLDSLKHLKDDVSYVDLGSECGVMSNSYNLWEQNDVIKVYELSEKKKEL